MPTGHSHRERRVRLALAAAGVLAALLVLEAVARLAAQREPGPRRGGYALRPSGAPGLASELVPNATFLHEYDGDPYGSLPPGGRVEYSIDSRGMRGPERPLDTGHGAVRVLVLGDSFAFGEGVQQEGTLAAVLEGELGARSGGRWRPQVLDAAVPGYGIEEELAQLRALAPLVEPQVVVLAWVPNDPIPLDEALAAWDDDLVNRLGDGAPACPSALLCLIKGRLEARRRTAEVEGWYRSYYLGERRGRWEGSLLALDAMASLCRRRGIALVVAVFPLMHELERYPLRDVHELVLSSLASRGVEAVDLLPPLAAEGTEMLWVHPRDHHPNARAHALAARALAGPVARAAERAANATAS